MGAFFAISGAVSRFTDAGRGPARAVERRIDELEIIKSHGQGQDMFQERSGEAALGQHLAIK